MLNEINFCVHRCRSRQIFRGGQDFCPNFPKLARKVFVWPLPTNFLPPQRSWRPFSDVTSKKSSPCVFLQTLVIIVWSQTTLGPIFSRCQAKFLTSRHVPMHRVLCNTLWLTIFVFLCYSITLVIWAMNLTQNKKFI